MKKTILTLLLAAMSSSVMAEWVKMFTYPDGEVVYANPSSINRGRDKATMWLLSDGNAPSAHFASGAVYLSFRVMMEYDCAQMSVRELRNMHYSVRMGKGSLVYDSIKDKPEGYLSLPVAPETPSEAGWELACRTNQIQRDKQ